MTIVIHDGVHPFRILWNGQLLAPTLNLPAWAHVRRERVPIDLNVGSAATYGQPRSADREHPALCRSLTAVGQQHESESSRSVSISPVRRTKMRAYHKHDFGQLPVL